MNKFDVHRVLFGQDSEITNYQLRVYGSPRVRAVSTEKPFHPERSQTALVIAMHQALVTPTREFHPVYLFVPGSEYKWVCGQIEDMAKGVTARVRSAMVDLDSKSSGKKVLAFLRRWIGQIHPGPATKWAVAAPSKWAAYGFTSEDESLPQWLSSTLG